jgi:NAD-dependent dihydropyrimidine dehydrogenase PreA subunit
MDTNLTTYINKYDKWLDEKTISHSSRVIPVKESLENVKHVLPTNQAEQILSEADCITLADCTCRRKYQNCDNPLEVCFVLNRSGEQWIEKGLSRKVSLDQARETLKQANRSGLVHMTLYKPDHEVFALCSCCACCCHDLQLVLSYGKRYILMHADFIAVDDPDLCLHCGACVDRCQFDARKITDDTLIYQQDLCYGCGLCITTCPAGAIQMALRI